MKAVTALHVAVRDGLGDLNPGDVVLVACSGGPDSLALAAATAALAGRYGWRAGAVVIDHGWSDAGSAASGRAAAACAELGLEPVELLAVDCSGPGGPEGAARTARYQALDAAAERHRAAAVLLGHTLDDQAETVLLGLGRGSGARSLAGMAAARGVYRRPLLGLRRSQTLTACAELGLRPWLDPANDDPAYARVRVRRLATELETGLGPGVVEALARSADLLREDADALDGLAAALLEAAAGPDGPTGPDLTGPDLGLDAAILAAAPAALRRRALLAAARSAGCPAGALGRSHALALDRLLAAEPGAGVDLPGSVLARLVVEPPGQGPVRRVRFERSSGYGKLGPVTGA